MSEHASSDAVHDHQLPSSASPVENQDSAPQTIHDTPLLGENPADSTSTPDDDATSSTRPRFTLGQAPNFRIGPPSTIEISLNCGWSLYSKRSFRLRKGHCVRREKPANLHFLTDLQYHRLLGSKPPTALVFILSLFSSSYIPSETFVPVYHSKGLFRKLHWGAFRYEAGCEHASR